MSSGSQGPSQATGSAICRNTQCSVTAQSTRQPSMATAADSTSSNASSVWGTSSYPPSPGAANDADQYGAIETGPSSTAASSVFLPDSGRARPRRKRDLRRFATQCATVDDPASDMHDQHNASSVPIYMTATFKGTAGAGKYDCGLDRPIRQQHEPSGELKADGSRIRPLSRYPLRQSYKKLPR